MGGEKVTTMDDILTKKCSDVGQKILKKSTNVRNNTNFARLYENSGENTMSTSTTAPVPTLENVRERTVGGNVRNNTNFASLYENSGENTTSSSSTTPAPTLEKVRERTSDGKKLCKDKCFVLVTNKR